MRVRVAGGTLNDRRETFERLTQARLDRSYRLASALLSDRDEAQDAVHDAVEQAWRDSDRLRDIGRFDAWFDSIVINRCRDRLRRRRGSQQLLKDPPDIPGPDHFSRSAEREALTAAVAELDADHRIVVVLRFVSDLSIAEIAARTGEREGTIKSRLHYALRHMRAAYDAAERTEGGAR